MDSQANGEMGFILILRLPDVISSSGQDMTQGALPLDAFSRYKLSLITTKFQQTQTDRKNKMRKSKPTPQDKQIAEANAKRFFKSID